MPLIKSKSKKAFSKNVETEMDSGKPQNQSLAIAYSVKRKAKKKASGGTVNSGSSTMNYADGGDVDHVKELDETKQKLFDHLQNSRFSKPDSAEKKADITRLKAKKAMHEAALSSKYAEGGEISAKTEKRSMPNMKYNDSMQVGENSNKKELIDDQWTSRPDIKQSTKGMRTTPIKHPKMVASNVLQARLRDEEDDLQTSAGVNNGPQRQPPEHDNEEDPNRQGKTPYDEATSRRGYANGGTVDPDHSGNTHNLKVDNEYGGNAEEDNQEDPAGLTEDNDQMRPAKEEYMADHMQMLAEGGIADEEEIEHAASIAAAIMARRKMASGGSVESGSEDMNMADGGQVDIEDNNNEEPNEYYHLNEEDVLDHDMNAGMPSNGQPKDSNEHGDVLEDEDEHSGSLAFKIRAKSKKRSPITR